MLGDAEWPVQYFRRIFEKESNKAEESTSLQCCRVRRNPTSVLPCQQTPTHPLSAMIDLIYSIHGMSPVQKKKAGFEVLML